MSVGRKVEKAIDMMDGDDPEEALFEISSAIDATAKKERKKGGRACYKDFIHENLGLITDVAFGKSILNLHLRFKHPNIETDERGRCTVEDVFYHAVRCGLYHEATLPSNLRFTGEGQIRVDEDSLVLPSSLVYGLIAAVVASPANVDERVSGGSLLNLGYGPMLLNCFWGKRDELIWLLDVRKKTNKAK